MLRVFFGWGFVVELLVRGSCRRIGTLTIFGGCRFLSVGVGVGVVVFGLRRLMLRSHAFRATRSSLEFGTHGVGNVGVIGREI